MADIESNIDINIDASDAMAALKELQRQISVFNQQMQKSSAANAAAASNLRNNLINNINATGKFEARIATIKTTTESFTEALEKNKLSMGQYFRYAGGATKTFGKLFKKEFDTIETVARDRVKTLQTQYIKLGRDANGAMKAISVKPLVLDLKNMGTQTAIAAQKQALLNQLLKQGSTNLLNFGKNTQWAGRQLMVGFTVPLTMLGTTASKVFMEMEQAVIKFKRVYGDLGTTMADTDKMVQRVELLAKTFTKYGVAVKDTMQMAADAAAMGKTGADLIAQITEASRLAVLGQVEQQQALETTMSLTNAFGTAAEDLAKKINFLNSVENQTATSIEDLTIAIPKAAPVIKQLGGDVEDLAFFLTAMKEGGINASEGANALKSGLASLINPTNKASEFLRSFGINVTGIVEANKGDVNGLVIDFAKALDKLDPLNRARAIEQMFGKFQFSRLSTLFQNVIKDGSQAQKVLEMTRATSEELAVLAERELRRVEDSPAFKFQKAMEDLKVALVPLGKAFLKAVTPLVEFATKILDQFNNLSDGAKSFVTNIVGIVGVIGPALLMGFGLVANGVANLIKLFTSIKTAFNNSGQSSQDLASQTEYMTQAQMEAAAVAASLDQTHNTLTQTLTAEAIAIDQLTQAYRRAVEAQRAFTITSPAAVSTSSSDEVQGYAKGTLKVPGPMGAGDVVPAMLSPGESVIPRDKTKKYGGLIKGIMNDSVPGFKDGVVNLGMPMSFKRYQHQQEDANSIYQKFLTSKYASMQPEQYKHQLSKTSGHSFPLFGIGGMYEKMDGTKVFVKPVMDEIAAEAEARGTQIARDAHGLKAPQQKIVVMNDPTDRENKRRFLALESPFDPTFAEIPETFSRGEYFKQLVASLLRGDKDLGKGNLGGSILADVGTAGVFTRASGDRALTTAMPSMEEQAIVNLLGVKGGAKKFFAQATADIARSMTPEEYDAAMKAEIQSVMPKLDSTIASFENLKPEEQQVYEAMRQRLAAGLSTDWRRFQAMHSGVKMAMGGMIPGYNNGSTNVKKESEYTPQEIYKLLKVQETHAFGNLDPKDPKVAEQLKAVYATSVPEDFKNFDILSNMTMSLPGKLNQQIKEGSSGVSGSLFAKVYNSLRGKLSKTAKMASVPNMADAQAIEDQIGQSIATQQLVKDSVFAKVVQDTINNNTTRADSIGGAANLIWERTKQVGTIRSKMNETEGSATNVLLGMLQRKEATFDSSRQIRTPFGARIGRFNFDPFGSSSAEASEEEKALRANAQKAADQWIAAGDYSAALPVLTNSKGGQSRLSLRDNSAEPGLFNTDTYLAYDSKKKGFESDLSFAPGGFSVLQGLGYFAEGTASVGGTVGATTGKPKASVFDIDDTLLDLSSFMAEHKAENEKLPLDQRTKWYKEVNKNPQPIPAGVAALKAAQQRGNKIILMTARPESYGPDTLETLAKLGIDMNGVDLIARQDKDYRKPHQMKYDKTSELMKQYDIEEFYDDMDETRGALGMLGINAINPLKLSEGAAKIGYKIFKDVDQSTLGMERFEDEKLGGTPGAMRMLDGKKHYVKQGFSEAETTSEVFSSALFSAMGNRGPQLQILDRNLVASKIIPGLIPSDRLSLMDWISKQPDQEMAAKTVAQALKQYIENDVPFNAAIGNIDSHENNILFNPRTKKFENIDLGNSVLAGFTGIADFGSVAYDDTTRMKGDIYGAIRDTLGKNALDRIVRSVGLSRGATTPGAPRDASEQIDRIAQLLGFDLSLTSTTDPATDPKNNRFIQQMIAENPELADKLNFGRQSSTSGKTFQESLQTLFTRMKRAKSQPVHFFNKGVFSVPGPKGAGDVVPAMLTPGEAVIPADKAEKHRGLITQMIYGKIPGYEDSNVIKPPGSIPGVKAPEPYMASEPAKKGIFDGLKKAVDSFSDKVVESSKKAGEAFVEKAKDAGEKVLGKVVDKYLNPTGAALIDSKGKVTNQATVDAREAEEAAQALREEMAINQRLSAQKLLESEDIEYARLREEQRNYDLRRFNVKEASEITEQEKQEAIARNNLIQQKEDLLLQEINANTAEGQALRQRISQSSGLSEQDVANLTTPVPGGPGDGKEKKSLGTRLKSFGGMMNKVGGVAFGANSIASMLPGEVGKQAQEMMIPIMSIASALPMLQSPLGALTVVVTAAVSAWAMYDGALKKGIETMVDLYDAIGSGTAAMRRFAEFTGKATAGEIMDKRREKKLNPFQIVPGKKTFGESFMESDQGKTLAKSYGDFLKTGATTQQARDQMANQLSTAVATGAMTAAQARSVAVNLGKELKDYSFAVDVNAKVATLVGPNGENLAKEALNVRMNLIQQTTKNVQRSQENLEKQGGMNLEEMGKTSGGAGLGLAAGAIGGLVAAPALLAMMGVAVAAGPVGWVVGATALVGALIGGVMGAAAHAERLGKLAGANVALQKQALEQSQEMIDSLDLEYEKRIDTAKLAGDMAKAEDLTNEHLKARTKLLGEQAKLNQSIIDGFEKSAYKDQLKEGARKVVAKKYKDTVFEDIAPIAQQNIYDSAATDAQEQQLMLAMATDLDPTMVLSLLEMFGKDEKELTAILDIQTNYGSAFTGELTGIAALFVNSAGQPVKQLQTQLVAKVKAAGSYEEAQELLDTYAAITRTSDTLQVDVIVDTVMKNPQIEQKLGDLIDFISEQKGKINFDIVADAKILDANSLALLKEDIEFFNNIKTKEQQQAYLFTLITSVNAITDVNDPAVQAWLGDAGIKFKDKPPGEILSEYAIWNARRFAEISGDFSKALDGNAGGDGGPDTSWLDDFNKRIRDVLKYTHQMTQGWAASKKAIEAFAKTGMNMFDGLEMKLKRAGATDELTGAILGLSKEDYDKYKSRLMNAKGELTDFARTLIKVTNQLAFGDAIVENDKIVLQAQNMSKAFSGAKNGMADFVKKGVLTAADAYEILSDATVASAFAADKEGKSRKALVKSYLMAKKAQWLMMDADEKRQKYVEMYNANLDIISSKEEEINKKYDERNEALDKIQQANDAIAKQNQLQLTLAEAFSKGDLSGAVRAAKEMEALAASQAVEARRASMEEARKNELEKIEVDINGVLMTRKDIEDQIKTLNDATALSKAAQLENEIKIGKEAEKNRLAVINWAASKDNPANKKVTGGGGGFDGKPTVIPEEEEEKSSKPLTTKGVTANLKGVGGIAGNRTLQDYGSGLLSKATSKTAAAEEERRLGNLIAPAVSAVEVFELRKENMTNGKFDYAELPRQKKDEYNKLVKAEKDARAKYENFDPEAYEKQTVKDLTSFIPKEILDAFTLLKTIREDPERTRLSKQINDAEKALKEIETRNKNKPISNYSTDDAENATAYKKILDPKNKNSAVYKLAQYDKKSGAREIEKAVAAKGYGAFRKYFAGYASGGMVMPKYMSLGGFAMGTDTVPAMLTPGEFIVSQPAVEEFGLGNLKAINSGTYGGNSVYNYSVNVNAGSNASADDIARAVMNKINEIDARRIRGNNF